MMKLTLIGGLIAIGLVVAFGLYLFVLGLRNVNRAVASSHWPRTTGKVVRSDTREQHDVDKETRVASVIYSADTVIQYEVAGKRYSTNLIHFGQTLGSGDASEAELQRLRYPVNGAVPVSYDPSRPWIAAARPGLHAEAFWLPGAGLAFLLPAAVALFVFLTVFGAEPQQSDVIAPVVAGLLAAVFCGLGILALSSGAQRLWRGAASQHWLSVEGTVLFSRVNASETEDSDHRRSTTFSPQFVYTYEVGGVKHFNNRRRFGQIEGSGEDWAEDIATRYQAGKGVRVYYYQADPDIAVLEPGNNSEGLWLPGIGLVALLFGLATLIWIVPAVAK
jgi:hypothetical protein